MILKSKEQKFHKYKSLISIRNISINKIVVSNKVSFGKKDFKYFIDCKDTKKMDLFKNKYAPFLIKDNKLSEK